MTDPEIRQLLREHALKLLDKATDAECDVGTMIEQARQTLGLVEAETAARSARFEHGESGMSVEAEVRLRA